MHKFWLAFLLCGMQLEAQDAAQKVVALDGFHNNESKMPDHYQWDGVRPGGFSELGKLLAASGAQLTTIRQRITPPPWQVCGFSSLSIRTRRRKRPIRNTSCRKRSRRLRSGYGPADGWYCLAMTKAMPSSSTSISLPGRFGIEFLEETYPKVKGKGILIAKGDTPIFDGALEVYLVEVAPLKLSAEVQGPARRSMELRLWRWRTPAKVKSSH